MVQPAGDAKMSLIAAEHQVSLAEVREAVVLTPVENSTWDYHPERGWRLYVTGTTYPGRRLFVVLFPVDEADGVWRLGTAMGADD